MTAKELYQALEQLKIPVTYMFYPENEAPPPPYICWSEVSDNDLEADNTNYQKIREIRVDLYSNEKDFANEAALEELLDSLDTPYDKICSYITNDKLFLTTYDFNIIM